MRRLSLCGLAAAGLALALQSGANAPTVVHPTFSHSAVVITGTITV